MIRLHAEHDGAEDLDLGLFATLQDAFEFICDESATDEYWMEGCDMVATDQDSGERWYLCGGAWEPGV